MNIDWTNRGRRFADDLVVRYDPLGEDPARTVDDIQRSYAVTPGRDERDVRAHFADLLAAVRWGTCCAHGPEQREAAALQLLLEGFRERLAEGAVGIPRPLFPEEKA
jgi:hypothetical protein